MASSFEKSVKGATKVKLAAPKSKYVEHILVATHSGEAGIAEVFRALNIRLKDSHWTVVFKALIIVHLMIREGEHDVTLLYLRKHSRILAVSTYIDAANPNIKYYAQYLEERARAFGSVQCDYVREGEGRLRKLSVEKGLLREVENVQGQLKALLRCRFREDEVDNEIALTAFRLLVMDLLVFFHVVNEGVINVLEHYFEMSRPDAERALKIYKVFTAQTAEVVEFLQTARRLESHTRLQIPNNLKHAPTSLTSSLEDYVNDPEFDTNRRQYLAEREAKRTGKPLPSASKPDEKKVTLNRPPATAATTAPSSQSVPAPDLIDFFDTIEKEQTSVFQPQVTAPAMTGYVVPQYTATPTNPYMAAAMGQSYQQTGVSQPMGFMPTGTQPQIAPIVSQPTAAPLQANFTGAGFGGYTPSNQSAVSAPPVPMIPNQFAQQQQPYIQQQQQPAQPQVAAPTGKDTNPFRASMMIQNTSQAPDISSYPTSPPVATAGQPKSTNPFKSASTGPTATSTPGFAPVQTGAYSQQPYTTGYPSAPLAATAPSISPTSTSTSTNPFARTTSPSSLQNPTQTGGSGLSVPSQTSGGATTNPFRASMMPKQGTGWEAGQQSIRGLENLETVPVFPRSGTQQQQQQTGWQ